MNKYCILLGLLTRILAAPARSETPDVPRGSLGTLRVVAAVQSSVISLWGTRWGYVWHFTMSVTNRNAVAGPSWPRWDSNNVQCLSCISLLPKPQLQLSSSPIYFLKWTKCDYVATQIPKHHHAIALRWEYALPWCWEVTLILMNSLQDFQCDYFPSDDLRLRGKSSERNKTKFSAASKGKCTFDSIPSLGFFPWKCL